MTRSNVAAVVGVRDEVELILPCIRHLQKLGIDIVVIDRASTDGTQAILAGLAHAGEIALIRDAETADNDSSYFIRGVNLARSTFAPDWIIIQDGDEFWYCAEDLRDVLARETSDIIYIPRYNACLSNRLLRIFDQHDTSWVESLDIFAQDVRLSREVMDSDPSLRWITGRPADKIAARAAIIADVTTGGHSIIGYKQAEPSITHSQDIFIVHVAFLTLERFRRKVENIREGLRRNGQIFKGNEGWHWKRWKDILDNGDADSEYENQFVDDATLETLRQDGIVRRVADDGALAEQ